MGNSSSPPCLRGLQLYLRNLRTNLCNLWTDLAPCPVPPYYKGVNIFIADTWSPTARSGRPPMGPL
jgi:hypothetical protein